MNSRRMDISLTDAVALVAFVITAKIMTMEGHV